MRIAGTRGCGVSYVVTPLRRNALRAGHKNRCANLAHFPFLARPPITSRLIEYLLTYMQTDEHITPLWRDMIKVLEF
jgi:hypothetical protein